MEFKLILDIGVIIAIMIHLITLTSKLSTFMAKSELDRANIHKNIEDMKSDIKAVTSFCKECSLRPRVETMDNLQQQLRRELPLQFEKIKFEMESIKSELGGMKRQLTDIRQALGKSQIDRQGRQDRLEDL